MDYSSHYRPNSLLASFIIDFKLPSIANYLRRKMVLNPTDHAVKKYKLSSITLKQVSDAN